MGNNAYLLFYARADVASGLLEMADLFPNEGRLGQLVDIEQIKKSAWVGSHEGWKGELLGVL